MFWQNRDITVDLSSLAKMSAILAFRSRCCFGFIQNADCRQCAMSPPSTAEMLRFMKLVESNVIGLDRSRKSLSLYGNSVRSNFFKPIKAEDDSGASLVDDCTEYSGSNLGQMSNVGKSTNILWHETPVQKLDRQKLLQQKGCVIWLTGLSGSGKSTLACALSEILQSRGKLAYILDGDNVRHGLNKDLSFRAEDRSENIRRIGEVAKLFADAGLICITSLITPYRKDRDACRALLSKGDFIEVFLDVPLHICESRDPKGLYKLARAGKITGFTGIHDPYEPPSSCEIVLQTEGTDCASPSDMAETVIAYLEKNDYLRA
ncbi:adenylyl-sulfate kinase 3 isoform X2 [Prosopis cineraria]|uniref:adenylyl-sulfate kinase 3 isoform X2 n=1 Tax=Prosopis cineraria TaxID=364024 RepID=UPI0024106CE5|nr:adenylyl-sulfate kinase 3 isoform X2 [Prosopis cineraria]